MSLNRIMPLGASLPLARPRLLDYDQLRSAHLKIFTRLDVLQERVGHTFADLTLLYEALTHRSALMELSVAAFGATPENGGMRTADLPYNERLEFLGDAVLGLCVSRRLMEHGAELAEGELSRIRAALVNEESLAELARRLGLGSYLVLGKGAAISGGRARDSLLADALEAVIGAVFVDAGYAAADLVVGKLFDQLLKGDLRLLVQTDFKTTLQELTQDQQKATPTYELISAFGPDHSKMFEVKVIVAGIELGRGQGNSKKRASQEAAKAAIDALIKGKNPAAAKSNSFTTSKSSSPAKAARQLAPQGREGQGQQP